MTPASPAAASFEVVRFHKGLDRAGFDCGVDALNRYFKDQVSQDIRRQVTTCYVLIQDQGQGQDQDPVVAGYYTLASSSIPLLDLSELERKKLPRYAAIPAYRMGRLAVSQAFQGQSLGAALLADALLRCSRAEAAVYALVVDAKDATAAAFYTRHGFVALPQTPLTLMLAINK